MQVRNTSSVKLTIITINYNDAKGLDKTLSYIDKHPLPDNVNWIVIDGGSSDDSVSVIKSKNLSLDFWISEPDSGIYHAMNKGVQAAKGEYVIFMNSGDQFVDGALTSELVDSLYYDIEYGDCLIEDDEGFTLEKQPQDLTFQSFYYGCICHQAAFVKKDLQERFPFDESMRLASCRKFFIESLVLGGASYKYINKPIAIYDTNGVSSKYKDQLIIELEQYVITCIPSMILKDMKRLRQFERITRNSRIYNLLIRIHPFSRRKRVFEKIVNFLGQIVFSR